MAYLSRNRLFVMPLMLIDQLFEVFADLEGTPAPEEKPQAPQIDPILLRRWMISN